MIERIDHTEQAKELMLSQFKDSETLNGLLESWMVPLQELEDSLHDFMENNGISTATGVMLDIIGEYFGVDRANRSDDQYRSAILARAISERTDGTTAKFISGLISLTQTNFSTFYDYFPRTVYAHVGGGYSPTIYGDIQRLKPAGRHLRVLIDIDHDSMVFVETLERDNNLVTGDLDPYIVVVDGVEYNLIVNFSGSDTLEESGEYLAEPFDEEFFPFADEISGDIFTVSDILTDENGDFIIDNEGNRFNVISYSY